MELVDFDFNIEDLLVPQVGDVTDTVAIGGEIALGRVEETADTYRKRRWSFASMLRWTGRSPSAGSDQEAAEMDPTERAVSPGSSGDSLLREDAAIGSALPSLTSLSSVLSPRRVEALRRHFPLLLRYNSWQLLYSLLQHGADSVSFFKLTKGASYSLLVIQTEEGEVVGGFATTGWTPAKEFCE